MQIAWTAPNFRLSGGPDRWVSAGWRIDDGALEKDDEKLSSLGLTVCCGYL